MQVRPATAADIDALMAWFPDLHSVQTWGGPMFDYPFDRDSFHASCRWQEMTSLCVCDGDVLDSFGQVYERYGRINLARLVVNPSRRGRGAGKRLIALMMQAGAEEFDCDECGLFVWRSNEPAYHCYRSMGFEEFAMPDDVELGPDGHYLVRPTRPLPAIP